MSEIPSWVLHELYLDGRGGILPPSAAPSTAENRTQQGTGMRWLHLDATKADAEHWLRANSDLSDVAIEGLFAEETRPRVICRLQRVLFTGRGINPDKQGDITDLISLRIWCDGERLISSQLRDLKSTQTMLSQLTAGEGACSLSDLVVDWLDTTVDDLDLALDRLEDELDHWEDAVFNHSDRNANAELSKLRRQCIALRRYLAPQRDAFIRLGNESLPWLDEQERLRLREVADRQTRLVENLDEIKDRAAVATEELQGQQNEEMNNRMYVMSIAAALFLPLGFFTGLLGINVGGLPGTENPYGFAIVSGLCLAILLLLVVIFRQRRWL